MTASMLQHVRSIALTEVVQLTSRDILLQCEEFSDSEGAQAPKHALGTPEVLEAAVRNPSETASSGVHA